MPDLETRFRGLDRLHGPDLWGDIQTREPRPMPDGGTGRRVAAAAVALVLAAGGALLVARAFLGGDRAVERPVRPAESPATPVDPVVDVTLPIRWPSSIVYGEGSIWVAASANDGTGAGTVYRIDPDTAEILAEIEVPSVPGWEFGGGGMQVAAGSLWIAGYLDEGDQGALLRVDGGTNTLTEVVPLGGQFAGDVAVDEHRIWVTVFAEPSLEVVRLDSSALTIDLRLPLGEAWAREIMSVDSNVWIEVTRNRLLRIDPDTGEVVREIRVPGAGFWSWTSSGGALWSPTWTKPDGNTLARVDPSTGGIEYFPSDRLETLIDVGFGSIWGLGGGSPDGSGGVDLVRFDPAMRRIDASVELDPHLNPIDLAVAPGSVWVIHYEEGVTRIELQPQ